MNGFGLRALAGGAAAGLALLGALSQVEAAPFTVINSNDAGPGSLRQAILDANASAGADTITFGPGGTGKITLTSATLTITGTTTITGPGANALTVSGNDALRPFTIASSADVTITGLRIAEGRLVAGTATPGAATAGAGGNGSGSTDGANGGDAIATGGTVPAIGGAAVSNAGVLLLDRVVVSDSRGFAGSASGGDATAKAGGAGNASNGGGDGGDGGDAIVPGGNAGDLFGAGIFNAGNMTLRGSVVSGNTVTAGSGGPAFARGGNGGAGGGDPGGFLSPGDGGTGGTATATGIRGGDALGGGIYNAGTLVVEASTVSGNSAVGGAGGFADARGSFGGAGDPGGGGRGGDGGPATATGGRGGDALGGGIANTGTLELRNTTVSGNSTTGSVAGGINLVLGGNGAPPDGGALGTAVANGGRGGVARGGGIAALGGAPTTTLASATIVGNRADSGANLDGSAPVTVSSSIVAAPDGGASCAGTIGSGGYNIDSAASCVFSAVGDQSSTDPQLGLLQDNGGPTPTMAPAQTSPAVDRGSSGGLATDQRGLPRPSDFAAIANASDGADIGAVELAAPPPADPPAAAPLSVELSATGKQRGTKLRATVTCSKDCEIDARGKGKAGGEKFKTKTARLSLTAEIATVVRLKLRKGDRRDVAGEKGKVKLTVTAMAGGESAADSSKAKLKP
jgi:hypothetical protein